MSMPFQKPVKHNALKGIYKKALPKILIHWKWVAKSTMTAISTLEATHGINFPEEADVNDK